MPGHHLDQQGLQDAVKRHLREKESGGEFGQTGLLLGDCSDAQKSTLNMQITIPRTNLL
jgi:hypothetical protein